MTHFGDEFCEAWRLPRAPFSCDRGRDLTGVILWPSSAVLDSDLSSPWRFEGPGEWRDWANPSVVESLAQDAGPSSVLTAGGERSYPSLGLGELNEAIGAWFSGVGGGGAGVDAVVLIRMLAVMEALVAHWRFELDAAHDLWRSGLGFVVVPGGNLDTLLWIAWRYAHAASVELVRTARAGAGIRRWQSVGERLWASAHGLGRCPGYPLDPTQDEADRRMRIGGRTVYVWGTGHVRVAAEQVVRWLGSARTLLITDTHLTRIRIRALDRARGPRAKAMARNHNFEAYRRVVLHALEASVLALRLVGHVAWQLDEWRLAWTARKPRSSDPVHNLNSLTLALEPIAESDERALDGLFVEACRSGSVPVEWLMAGERMLHGRWLVHAPFAAMAIWGVFPGDPDEPRRYGRYLPPGARLLPVREPPPSNAGP